MKNILEPFRIKNVTFQNRVVFAATVIFGCGKNEDGIMTLKLMEEQLKRAENRIGIFVSQSLGVADPKICKPQKIFYNGVTFYKEEHKEYLSQIIDKCHSVGTKFFAQLSYQSTSYQDGGEINHLTIDQIEFIRDSFINSARLCMEAGGDGIEIQGAHGTVLNMFASPVSNKRTDQYGGGTSERYLLLREIVSGIREFAGDDFIISYRLGTGLSLEEDIEATKELKKAGVELIHVSYGIPKEIREGSIDIEGNVFDKCVAVGVELREYTDIPLTVVNSVSTLARGNCLIENNACDFVAYARPFLADEHFFMNSLDNMDYKPCFMCKRCLWFETGEKCPSQCMRKKKMEKRQ